MTTPSGITINFPRLTESEFKSCSSESEKCVSEFWRYTLVDGKPAVGIDLASGGRPALPWALSFDLPHAEYSHYNSGHKPQYPLHLRGFADQNLPFESESFAWCISSHFLEDFVYEEWPRLIREWARIVKHGGYLIVLVPDKDRWNYAIRELGQCPNCAHQHESAPGELSVVAKQEGLEVIEDRLTSLAPHDYGILGVFRKP